MAQTPAQKQAAYRGRLRMKQLGLTPMIKAAAACTAPPLQRWRTLLHSASRLVAACQVDLQTYIDARSDQWQESDNAGVLQELHSNLDDVIYDIEAAEGLISKT